jgi:hypothetical protein
MRSLGLWVLPAIVALSVISVSLSLETTASENSEIAKQETSNTCSPEFIENRAVQPFKDGAFVCDTTVFEQGWGESYGSCAEAIDDSVDDLNGQLNPWKQQCLDAGGAYGCSCTIHNPGGSNCHTSPTFAYLHQVYALHP